MPATTGMRTTGPEGACYDVAVSLARTTFLVPGLLVGVACAAGGNVLPVSRPTPPALGHSFTSDPDEGPPAAPAPPTPPGPQHVIRPIGTSPSTTADTAMNPTVSAPPPPSAPLASADPQGHVQEEPALPPTLTAPTTVPEPSAVLLAQQAEVMARWNLGGSSDPSHPSSQPRFHSGTRVVIDAELAGVFGRQGSLSSVRNAVQARVRARGYWPLRACYDTAWRRGHDGPTDHTIRATVLASGHIRATRTLEHDGPRELTSCLRSTLQHLELGPLPARRVDADLHLRFWPGDAPLPRDVPLGEDTCTGTAAQAPLAQARALWEGSTRALNRCVSEGLDRDERLWGRLALRAEFDQEGSPTSVFQFQTQMPDDALVACVTEVVQGFHLPAAPCSANLVFALRIGELGDDP